MIITCKFVWKYNTMLCASVELLLVCVLTYICTTQLLHIAWKRSEKPVQVDAYVCCNNEVCGVNRTWKCTGTRMCVYRRERESGVNGLRIQSAVGHSRLCGLLREHSCWSVVYTTCLVGFVLPCWNITSSISVVMSVCLYMLPQRVFICVCRCTKQQTNRCLLAMQTSHNLSEVDRCELS